MEGRRGRRTQVLQALIDQVDQRQPGLQVRRTGGVSPEKQMERAMRRVSYSKEEVLARLSRQLPLEEKVRVADYVIDTSGTKEQTIEQVKTVYNSLRSLSA